MLGHVPRGRIAGNRFPDARKHALRSVLSSQCLRDFSAELVPTLARTKRVLRVLSVNCLVATVMRTCQTSDIRFGQQKALFQRKGLPIQICDSLLRSE